MVIVFLRMCPVNSVDIISDCVTRFSCNKDRSQKSLGGTHIGTDYPVSFNGYNMNIIYIDLSTYVYIV